MSARIPSNIRWKRHKTKEELLDDPLAESLFGLFLKVKDSPRHLAFKPEKLINEVYFICNCFYQDADPCANMDLYAHEIEKDMGWRYATELVMSMAFVVLSKQRNLPKKIHLLLGQIEDSFGKSCYWDKCKLLVNTDIKKKSSREQIPIQISGIKDIDKYLGKQPVLIIKNVEQLNAILGNNATIQKTE